MKENGPQAPTDYEVSTPPVAEVAAPGRGERFMRSVREIFRRSDQAEQTQHESNSESKEDDDDSTESGPSRPRRRVAKFLRSLGIARRNTVYDAPAETPQDNTEASTFDTLFSRDTPRAEADNPTLSHEAMGERPRASASESPVPESTFISQAPVETSRPATDGPESTAGDVPPVIPVDTHSERVPSSGMSPLEVLQQPHEPNGVTYIDNRPNTWGPAIATGVVVDQLSRHRDRKIRKSAHKTDEKLNKLTKSHEELQQKHERSSHEQDKRNRKFEQQHEQHRKQTAERIEQPQPQAETTIPLHANKEAEVRLRQPEQAPKREYQEVSRTVEAASPELRPPAQPEARPMVERAKAELVLQQVEAAAEQDIALEKQYEQRHEVKDVATSRSQAHGGAFGANASQMTEVAHPKAALPDTAKPRLLPPPPRNQEEAYKRAMMAGFWTAMIIIIFVLLVAVLFRLQG